jgi:hypothetical protein
MRKTWSRNPETSRATLLEAGWLFSIRFKAEIQSLKNSATQVKSTRWKASGNHREVKRNGCKNNA